MDNSKAENPEFIIGTPRMKLKEFNENERDKGVAIRVALNYTSDRIFEDELEKESAKQGK